MLKTLKRKIALVAVAGLGFGLVSTVPANAAVTAWGAAATLSAANSTVATGATSHATNVSVDPGAHAAIGDTATCTVALPTVPTGSAATLAGNVSLDVSGEALTSATAAYVSSTGVATITATAAANDGVSVLGALTLTTDIAGVYEVTVTCTGQAAVTYTVQAVGAFSLTTRSYRKGTTLTFGVTPGTTIAANRLARIAARVTSRPSGSTAATVEVGDMFSAANETGTAATNQDITLGRANTVVLSDALTTDVTTAAADGEVITTGAKKAVVRPVVADLTTNVGDSVAGVDGNGDGDFFDPGEIFPVATTDYFDTAGTYGVFFWYDGNGDNLWSANEAFVNGSVSIGDTPTTFTITPASTTAAPTAATNIDVKVLDANGVATTLAAGEVITLTATTTSGSPTKTFGGVGSTIDNTDNQTAGTQVYRATLALSTAGSVSLSGNFSGAMIPLATAISGGTLSTTTITAVTSLDVKAGQVLTDTADTTNSYPVALVATAETGNVFADTVKAKAITYVIKGTAGTYAQVIIAAAGTGLPTGVLASNESVLIPASGAYEWTVTTTDLAPAGKGYTVTVEAGAADFVYTTVYNASTVNGTTITNDKVSTVLTKINTAPAGTSSFTLTVVDEYAQPQANYTVVLSTTALSRNASKTVTAITGADGKAKVDLVDASTSTTNLTDVASFAVYAPGSAVDLEDVGDSVTISYGTTLAKLTITGGDTATVPQEVQVAMLEGGATVARDELLALTFTLTDATGLAVTGYGVAVSGTSGLVFATADATAVASLTATKTVANTATVWVGCVKTGAQTVTATSGGITGTATLTCASAAANARNVAIKGGTNSATVTVTDGHGNGIAGVTVAVVLSGAGTLGNGQSSTTVVTASDGTATLAITGNAAGTGKATASLDAVAYVQSNDAAATPVLSFAKAIGSATADVTVTAATAAVNPATDTAITAVKNDVKAVSDTVATLSKAVTTIQSSVTELTSSFSAQIKSLSSAIAKISKAIAALSKKIK